MTDIKTDITTDITTDINKISYKLDYKFQENDVRDHVFDQHPELEKSFILKSKKSTDTIILKNNLPSKFNLYRVIDNTQINILDQGELGSCVANAFALNISYITKNNNNLCRLLLYALCRIMDQSPLSNDAGTTIRSAGNSISKYGTCHESVYPYNRVNVANYKSLPPLVAFKNSNLLKSFSYTFVSKGTNYLNNIKAVFNTYNVPIIFGFMVYPSFMSSSVAKTGRVSMPDLKKEQTQGGHAMNIIGYNDEKQIFICANSWGVGWGDNGFCYMPYAYILNTSLASDLCFIRMET
jgi:C1A family cysteine protease